MSLLPSPPPIGERMTPRARVYMAICAARHGLLGLACLVRPQDFTSGSFSGVRNFLHWAIPGDPMLRIWGVAFGVVAALAVAAVLTGRPEVARNGLLGSVIVSFCWVGGFIASIWTGQSAGWSGVIVWAAITLKDLTMLQDPLRNPFEPLIRKEERSGSTRG
ncbi:hypothetical protein [Cellulomonas taurus]|uniref:hypothetical protein n=1 Tax=Cellulomonas taurus TaxID=2729175 RepID=UPI00145D3AFB|nr:hypothetical protein [Cellulomonas taurus]